MAENYKVSKDLQPVFFSRPVVNWLIRVALSRFKQTDDGDQINDAELQQKLFYTLLIANESYFVDTNKYPLDSYQGVWRIHLQQQASVGNFLNNLGITFFKSLLFRHFIRRQLPNGEQFIQEFQNALGLTNYFEYDLFVVNTAKNITESTKADPNAMKWFIEETQQNKRLIDQFSTTPNEYQRNLKIR